MAGCKPAAAKSLCRFNELQLDVERGAAVAEDAHADGVAHFEAFEQVEHIVAAADLLVGDGGDGVEVQPAGFVAADILQAGLGGGAARLHILDDYALEAKLHGPLIRRELNAGQAGTLHLAEVDQLRHDAADIVHRDGEADAGRRPRSAEDGGVDANEPAAAVKQRSAGVPRIDRRVGLDHALEFAAIVAFDLPAKRADDAAG